MKPQISEWPKRVEDDGLVAEIHASLGPKFKHLAPMIAEEYRKQQP